MSKTRAICMALGLGLLLGCAATDPTTSEAPAETIFKSPNDDRAYRYLELDNGLETLLVSDPDTDKSAASLVVYRGSMHDPEEFAGLAHFLEHMLFIGTEKYPEVDGYQSFINSGGGRSNAYTAGDHTNYFFDISPEPFPEALDRFAQFFISPLFSAEYVGREKNAVHSEYQLQIKDDAWRENAVQKMALNPDHPAARFNIGSLDTLDGDVREALLEFFEAHYSADQMALVVYDARDLDELEALVRPMFSPIANREIGPAHPDAPVYADNGLPSRLYFQPEKEERSVTYQFPIPSTRPMYRDQPGIYITNLLGHEGSGSLLQALKRKGWVTALFAGGGHLDIDESAISVGMSLTEEGAEHLDEITGYLFAYIDLLQATPPEEWRYQEQATVADLGFRFMEQQTAMSTVYQLAPAFMHLPPQEVIRARFLMEQFDGEAIQSIVNALTPDNVAMTIKLPGTETNRTEPWFGVPYRLESGPIPMIRPAAQGLASLALPPANPFLPESLELLASSQGQAQRVVSSDTAEIWHHTDTSFGAPKANLRMNLMVDGGLVSAADIANATLYQALVADALNEFAYNTYLAGMSYGISAKPAGFRLQVSGYSDKQAVLLDQVLETFATLAPNADRFEVIKTEQLQELGNARNERPFNQAFSTLDNALVTSSWPPEALERALAPITLESLITWRDEHLAKVQLIALAHGNVAEETAIALQTQVAQHFELAPVLEQESRVIELDAASNISIPVAHNDAAYVAYLQDADDTWESRAKSALAVQLLRQGYFTSLRTEQQLGYVVAMTNHVLRRRGGIAFIVQSPVASAGDLMAATSGYLAAQASAIQELPEAAFLASRQGLLSRLRQEDKNLQQRTNRYWGDIVDEVTTLDSAERIASAVESLTKADMESYISALGQRLSSDSLVVYSPGQFDPLGEHGEGFENVEAFKAVSTPQQATDDTAAASAAASGHSAG